MEKIKLTYFTPTYNREKLLPNLYKSLLAQSNKNFIWLIVDDGSKDNTETLVNGWKKENKIKIEYVKKENGGKHTAIELSNQICTTEFITCVDSDDTLTPDATKILYSKFNLCSGDDIVGLLGPKTVVNAKYKIDWQIENENIYFYDLKKILGVVPETTLVFKTEIAKKFHFPIFEDEKFVTESVYYNQFFYDYKFATFKEEVYLAEFQDDGYTKMGMGLFEKNPKGYAYALKQNACLAIKQKISFKEKVKKIMAYYGWKSLLKTPKEIANEYNIPCFYKFIGWLTTPLSNVIIKRRLKK